MTPAAVRDALLRRALEVRPRSMWAAAWLSDASLVAVDFREIDGARVLGPGTAADVDELVRVAHGVEPDLVAWASGLLRQVTRRGRRIVDDGDADATAARTALALLDTLSTPPRIVDGEFQRDPPRTRSATTLSTPCRQGVDTPSHPGALWVRSGCALAGVSTLNCGSVRGLMSPPLSR